MRINLNKILVLPAVVLSLLLCSCSLGEPKEQSPAPSKENKGAVTEQKTENKDSKENKDTAQEQNQKAVEKEEKVEEKAVTEPKEKLVAPAVPTTLADTTAPAPAVPEVVPPAPENGECSITLQVTYPKEAGLSNINQKITVAKDQSVLECLVAYGKDNKVPVVYSGAKSSGYVEGINGIFEFDYGPESGWVYSVNGSKPQKSAGSYKMKDGDSIVWSYVLKLDEAF